MSVSLLVPWTLLLSTSVLNLHCCDSSSLCILSLGDYKPNKILPDQNFLRPSRTEHSNSINIDTYLLFTTFHPEIWSSFQSLTFLACCCVQRCSYLMNSLPQTCF
ncbi:hypothetical protein DL96DRAFT_373806 [Flagelloscypha sp. PMI_526]|nr:hypothetical protein DL96DRAFT_373806 [Flagelloscypha sp. PMI_526]